MSEEHITAVPLRQLPELPSPLTVHDKVVAQAVVALPVVLLVLLGIGYVGWGFLISVTVWSVLVSEGLVANRYDAAVNALVFFFIFAGPGCVPLIGGILLRQLRGRGFVVFTTFIAMLLPPFVPGILAFIWTLKSREPLVDRCFREPIQLEITRKPVQPDESITRDPIQPEESITRWPNNFD